MEDCIARNFLECSQDSIHAQIANRRHYVYGIIHTLLGVSVCWKFQIQPLVSYDFTDGKIQCLYKSVNKTKSSHRYMESLGLPTGAPTVYWEDGTHCISIVDAKLVTPRVKHVGIPVFFARKIQKCFIYS